MNQPEYGPPSRSRKKAAQIGHPRTPARLAPKGTISRSWHDDGAMRRAYRKRVNARKAIGARGLRCRVG